MRYKLCGRTPGISLNEAGRRQAASLATALQARRFERIYSSPLERALETAQYIGSELAVDQRLNELDFGEWTGRDFSELHAEALWHDYNRARSAVTPPGGEPPLKALARVEAMMNEIARDHAESTVAVMTHADIIRSFLTSVLLMSLDHLLRIDVAPASVSEVSMGGAYPIVRSLNRTYEQLI